MNTSPSLRRSRFASPASVAWLALISVAGLAVSGCCPKEAHRAGPAQVAGEPAKGAAGAEAEADASTRQVTTRVTLDFPGGTLGDLRKHLPVAPNEPFNLIVSDEFAVIPLPAFSVRDADSSQLARALSHQLYSHGLTIEPMDVMTADSGATPVYVTYSDPQNRLYSRMGDLLFRSVEMEPAAAARLAPAVQSAWTVSFQSTAAPAALRYHADTRQLFVSGPKVAMDVFEEVMRTFQATGADEAKK